jgi:hypothetical protein
VDARLTPHRVGAALEYDRLVSPRWFRVAYARNAFLRLLADSDLDLSTLTPAAGARAMVDFCAGYRPQHGVLDELVCSWGPADGGIEFAITRRLQRDGQPEAPLRLTFVLAVTTPEHGEAVVESLAQVRTTPGYRAIGRARILSRRLEQRALAN